MLRLTFIARNGVVELLSQQQVDMKAIAPRSETGTRHEFWYELRDAQDAALSAHPAPDPMQADIEVFSDDPARSASRAPDTRAERVFSVVLPEAEGAQHVALMRRASGAPHAAPQGLVAPAPATVEIARVALKKG